MKLQEFSKDEVTELQRYIEVHAHVSVLQKIYTLSENPLDKALIFVNVFRILNSCKNYTTDKLSSKLGNLLNEAKEVYDILYPLITKHENISIDFGKGRLSEKIIRIVAVPTNLEAIHKLIDAFLVFGEKIELYRTEDYMGIDLETDAGKEVMKDTREIIEKEKI